MQPPGSTRGWVGTMAKPMTVAQWRKQLKKFGQKFVEKPGFTDPRSGRDHETGLFFGPVYGGLIHHTGSDGPDRNNSSLIQHGRSDLPGPLAHSGCRDDGVIELFSTGRVNHAGRGDADVYRAVRTENYGATPPKPNRDEIDGNDCLYGLEIYYSGSKPPTKAAYAAAVNWSAAICDFHDWTAKSFIGHGEWSYRKWDPGNINTAKFREDVYRRIAEVNKKIAVKNDGYDTDRIVKIMSWNCGHQTEKKVMEEVRWALRTHTPDIFMGQEFYDEDDYLNVPSYNFRYQYHGPCPEYPKYVSEHPANMVVCRNTGVVKATHALEMLTPWKGPNMGIWHSPRLHRGVTFNTGNVNIRGLNFHGLAVKTGREESLEAARDYLEQMSQLGPAFVVGDFNADRAEVKRKIADPVGATVDGGGIDLLVYKNMTKVKGQNFSKHGSDHDMKMWTMKF
jgi:hypothetical protein